MKTPFKGLLQIYFLGFVIAMFMSITSCDNQELLDLKALVPEGETDKIAYINQAIALKNSFENIKNSKDRVGHPISQELSNQITRYENECLDSTQAIFFSFVNIIETIEQIGIGNIDSTFGLAVVFGRYPDSTNVIFDKELKQKNINPGVLANKPTVVLKYVRNLGMNSEARYYRKSDITTGSNQRGQVLDEQYITNMGMLCPKMCPDGTQ